MFYLSPWTLFGLIFCTAYFVLVLCGFGRKGDQRKVSQKSNEESVSSTKYCDDEIEETQARIADQKLNSIDLGNDSQGGRSDTQRQIHEGTLSCEIPYANNSLESSKQAPAHSDEGDNLTVKQILAPVKSNASLRSQDALNLQEFNISEDFVTERGEIRGRGNNTSNSNANEYFSEFLEGSTKHFEELKFSRENQGEISNIVTKTSVGTVSSAPEEYNFAAFENEQPILHSEPCVDAVEANYSETDLNKNSLFGDFAELLVTKAATNALSDVDLELRANVLAENISTQIVYDAIGQLSADSGKEEFDAENVQEIHSFAGDVINSLFQGATGKVSLVKDVESFAKDLSEQIISEGVLIYTAKQKFEQGRKKKVSLGEIRIFSEDVVSEVLSDGIEEAALLKDEHMEDYLNNKNTAQVTGLEDPVPHNADSSGDEVCQAAYQEVAISSSLQPHFSGVVENLVNGAIYEASLRVRAHPGNEPLQESELQPYSQDVLESQVDETVKELIFSAVNEAADHENQKSSIAQETMPMIQNELESQVGSYVDNALQNAVSEASVKVLEGHSEATHQHIVLNGHVDLSQHSVVESHSCQSTPEDVGPVEKETEIVDQSEGYDIVPSKHNNLQTELTGQKSGDNGDFWRRSLILDLEGDEEFDEAVESEKSLPSAGDSTSPTNDDELISDEDVEFIDSSEDEVIDHAEDAKLGAVGGSNAAKHGRSDDDRLEIEDDIDTVNEDDDDDTDDDDEELFVPQSTVDGLCVSKPKDKDKKKKHKTLPRARIQSAGSHYNNAVVIDNGCGTIKLGMAGEKKPSVVQPALYGIPKRYSLQMAGLDNKKDRQFGDAAAMKAGVMQLEYPMKAGLIENWSDIEDIWEYMLYSELGIEEGSNPILVTEVANTPRKNREKMAEILFEHLSAPAMYLANQLVLSLYASGLTVGMCLSSGFSVTQAAAIYEGCLLAHTVQELDIGGQSLTDNLLKLLRDNKGHNFNSSSGWQIVNNMKEKMAYVAQDYPSELRQYKTSAALTQHYKLPDGQFVDISSEMITTAEPLFTPETLLGADDTVASQFPIHKLVNNAFRRCSPELQSVMSRNVVLSGGTTLMRGLVPRLEHELSKINPKVRTVRAPDNRRYSTWIGGSILGALSTIDSMYVTIDEYADYGGRIVNQKCF